MDEHSDVGRRLREIRVWRGLTLRATAELAGLSESYLSRIERGQRPIERRSTLEALAGALRVIPSDLTGLPTGSPGDPVHPDLRAAVGELEVALSGPALGEYDDEVEARPWSAVRIELARLNRDLRPAADYIQQSRLLPGLLAELHSAMRLEPMHRHEILVGLFDVYHACEELAKTVSVPGLPVLAAAHAQTVAEELGDPAYLGMAAWVRGMAIGTTSRTRARTVVQRAADELRPALDDPAAAQVFGSLQLSAALAATVQGDHDAATEHLGEADAIAGRVEDEPLFGLLYFNRANVGIWRVSLAVEHGDPGRVVELARGVDPTAVPSRARRAMFYGDLGRGLAAQRGAEEQAVAALRTAEEIGPETVRGNYLIRETVTDLLRRARRDAGGRELRGLAYRMGLAG